MTDELPASPGATFAQPTRGREPLVIVEIDRRAVTIDGIETATCLQCGEAKASVRAPLRVPGRFSSIDLRVAICDRCRESTGQAYKKVRTSDRVVRGLYFAQLAALVTSMAGGGGGFLFTSLSLLLVGTMGASFVAKRRWLREQPRLVSVGPTSVRLRVPRSWLRVLSDEKPRVLVGAPASPPGLPGPGSPR